MSDDTRAPLERLLGERLHREILRHTAERSARAEAVGLKPIAPWLTYQPTDKERP